MSHGKLVYSAWQDFDMWSFSERHSVERLHFFTRRKADPQNQHEPRSSKQVIHVKTTDVAPHVSRGRDGGPVQRVTHPPLASCSFTRRRGTL